MMTPGEDRRRNSDIEAAINALAVQVGEVRGGFANLKPFIEGKTSECRANYIELNNEFKKIGSKINKLAIEDAVNGKIQVGRDHKATLWLSVAMVVVTALGVVNMWASKINTKRTNTVRTEVMDTAYMDGNELMLLIKDMKERLDIEERGRKYGR